MLAVQAAGGVSAFSPSYRGEVGNSSSARHRGQGYIRSPGSSKAFWVQLGYVGTTHVGSSLCYVQLHEGAENALASKLGLL